MTTSILYLGSQKRNLLSVAQELKLELPFFCQIDEQTHSALESTYRCDQCAIYICGSCYIALTTVVNLTTCHHCHGTMAIVIGLDKI